ncbi:hypothetical protein BC940DRAFT_146669 [Gongronella butleri]|nr:hypothetical protein BC940DRAFT_146669 [Gongronella butleri]
MSTYGALPMTNQPETEQQQAHTRAAWRESLGETLESNRMHWVILGLTMLDTACVCLQILYTFFHECESPNDLLVFTQPSEVWLAAFEIAETVSLTITCLFVIECFLALVAFGPRFYLPGTEHWKLHIFDVVVVVSTFVLEIVLRGREREVAGLLIILRLWRIVKVLEAVVVGMSISSDSEVDKLEKEGPIEAAACPIK